MIYITRARARAVLLRELREKNITMILYFVNVHLYILFFSLPPSFALSFPFSLSIYSYLSLSLSQQSDTWVLPYSIQSPPSIATRTLLPLRLYNRFVIRPPCSTLNSLIPQTDKFLL